MQLVATRFAFTFRDDFPAFTAAKGALGSRS
jgi:hypothetical protein